MKVWILEQRGTNTSCGEAYECVVVAPDETEARKLAALHHGLKWSNMLLTSCVQVDLDEPKILLVAYASE